MAGKAAAKGLRLDVYKHAGASCSNGGISARVDQVTLVAIRNADGIEGPVPLDMQIFTADGDAPPVVLVTTRFSFGEYTHVEPVERGEGAGPMAGGCFVGTSDSRFATAQGQIVNRGALPLHDRFEPRAVYDLMND